MKDKIRAQFDTCRSILDNLSRDEVFMEELEQVARICISCLRNGNAIFLAGNGGSAADAQHIAAELSGRFELDRPPLNAEALHVNTSYLTAVANDYGYERVYSRLIRAKGNSGDVFIALSTSGNSPNILAAAEAAIAKKMTVLAFTGRSGGKLRDFCDISLKVPSSSTARIQEIHIMIGHWLCGIIEQDFFGSNKVTE